MTEDDLKLEIGSEAFEDLTLSEVAFIVGKYSDVKQAGMKAFELLWKKFKPTYKMGRLYERESEKYTVYRNLYMMYSSQLGAGRSTSSVNNVKLKRNTWLG